MSLQTIFEGQSKFIFVNILVEFDEAVELCKQEYDANLATFESLEETLYIQEFFKNDETFTAYDFWIGLRREEDANGTDPTSFSFIDNTPRDTSFFEVANASPWSTDRPNNNVNETGNEEACVNFFIKRENSNQPVGWNDIDCNRTRDFLCVQQLNGNESSDNEAPFITNILFAGAAAFVCSVLIVSAYKLSSKKAIQRRERHFFERKFHPQISPDRRLKLSLTRL